MLNITGCFKKFKRCLSGGIYAERNVCKRQLSSCVLFANSPYLPSSSPPYSISREQASRHAPPSSYGYRLRPVAILYVSHFKLVVTRLPLCSILYLVCPPVFISNPSVSARIPQYARSCTYRWCCSQLYGLDLVIDFIVEWVEIADERFFDEGTGRRLIT